MGLSLQKGGNLSLTKVAPNLSKIVIGLGWDARSTDGAAFDLDASLFMVSATGKVRSEADFIFYNQTKSTCGSIEHTGDNRTGVGEGDDEAINVHLAHLPEVITRLVVAVTIHDADTRRQSFGQIGGAFMRIVNAADNSEIARFDLSEDYSTETAMIFGEVYRHHGEWKFKAVGQGYSGGLEAMIKQFGGEVITTPNTTPLPQEPPRLSLEKRIAQEAPQLLSLAKKATISLQKKGLTQLQARVGLVLDASGSMNSQYQKGRVQEVIERLLPLAVHFDDDGSLDCWGFAQYPQQLSAVTLANYVGYIEREKGGWRLWPLGARINDEPAVIRKVIDFYQQSKDKTPAYVLFISDGGVGSSKAIKELIISAAKLPIFWQFVGVGGSDYGILERLDDMKGRVVDNCNFFALDDLHDVSEQDLYDRLLEEFPTWLKEATAKGIVSK